MTDSDSHSSMPMYMFGFFQACGSPSTKKPRRGVGSEPTHEQQLRGVIEHKTVYTGPSDGRIGRETPKSAIAAARFH